MHLSVHRLPRLQRGLTSVEYALVGGLIVAIIVLALSPYGAALKAGFDALFAAF